jgi:hypothetical protein
MLGWIFILFIDFLIFLFISFKASFIFFIISGTIFIWRMGFFRRILFNTGVLKEIDIYYKEYTGDYYYIYEEYEKIDLIINRLKLNKNEYFPFGLYYDDPKKTEASKCRAIVGIIKEIKEKENKKEENNTESCVISKGYKKSNLPETDCLFSFFEFINPMSKVLGINKFYSTLESSLQSEQFRKTFNIDKKKYKLSVEIYKGDKVFFFVPLKNYERFNLHSNKFN